MANLTIIFLTLCLMMPTLIAADGDNEILDVEPPTYFSYTSPLHQPDSLSSQPYFDFLSTLYRRDADKSNLFTPYRVHSNRARSVVQPTPFNVAEPADINVEAGLKTRQKRAIIFRPLFVYRQQQVRRQHIYNHRRHRL